jgi:hypothetical protein
MSLTYHVAGDNAASEVVNNTQLVNMSLYAELPQNLNDDTQYNRQYVSM